MFAGKNKKQHLLKIDTRISIWETESHRKIQEFPVTISRDIVGGYLHRGKYLFVAEGKKLSLYSVKGKKICKDFVNSHRFCTKPLFFKGSVFVGDTRGNLIRLKIQKKNKRRFIKERSVLLSPIKSLSISNKNLYVTTQNELYQITTSLIRRWKHSFEVEICPPTFSRNRVYVSAGKNLYVFTAGGVLGQKIELPKELSCSPVVVGNVIYAITKDSTCYTLEQNGKF